VCGGGGGFGVVGRFFVHSGFFVGREPVEGHLFETLKRVSDQRCVEKLVCLGKCEKERKMK
jgi:hypothetical protein